MTPECSDDTSLKQTEFPVPLQTTGGITGWKVTTGRFACLSTIRLHPSVWQDDSPETNRILQ